MTNDISDIIYKQYNITIHYLYIIIRFHEFYNILNFSIVNIIFFRK